MPKRKNLAMKYHDQAKFYKNQARYQKIKNQHRSVSFAGLAIAWY